MRLLVIDNLAVESSRRYLYRQLAKQIGETVYLLVPEKWIEQSVTTQSEKETDQNLKVYSSPFLFGFRHQRIIYLHLKKVIAEVKPDAIFISSEPENFNTFHLVRIVKKYFPNTKLVCASWRNMDYRINPYPYKFGWINRLIENYNIKRIDICIAHSPSAKYFLEKVGKWKVVYIPPSINLEEYPFQHKTHSENSEKFVVGYIGRLAYEKGVDILIRAISRVDKNVHAIIVGDGKEKEHLKILARELKIDDRIIWQDAIPYKEVPKFIQQFDALVLPSRTTNIWKEQFGRVLIEAMALGVPVIGSDSGDIPSVIGECGLIFKENNAEELTDLLKRLISDRELLKTLVTKGREKIEKEYPHGVIAQKYVKIFNKSLIESR
jgi:glycosyltransferase involved in cell wall biosynthesis